MLASSRRSRFIAATAFVAVAAVGMSMLSASEPKADSVSKESLRYDGKDFHWWRQYLRTELKPEHRVEAIRAMGEFGANGYGDEATAAVIELLPMYDFFLGQEPAQQFFAASMSAMSRIGPESEARSVLALDSPNVMVRRGIVRIFELTPSSSQARNVFGKASSDADVIVRQHAIGMLGAGGPEAVPALTRALKHDDVQTCLLAVQSLGTIGGGAQAAVPDLIPLCSHASPQIRSGVLAAFVSIMPDPIPLQVLIKCIEDDVAAVRSNAMNVVVKLGPKCKDAVPALSRTIMNESRPLQERILATEALGAMGSEAKEALPTLNWVLQGDREGDNAQLQANARQAFQLISR